MCHKRQTDLNKVLCSKKQEKLNRFLVLNPQRQTWNVGYDNYLLMHSRFVGKSKLALLI